MGPPGRPGPCREGELEKEITFRSTDGIWTTVPDTESGNGVGLRLDGVEMKPTIDAQSPLEDLAAWVDAHEIEGIKRVRAIGRQEWWFDMPPAQARARSRQTHGGYSRDIMRWKVGDAIPPLDKQTSLPGDWLDSSATGGPYYARMITLQRQIGSSVCTFQIDFRTEASNDQIMTDPFLLSAIERDAVWELAYGSTVIDIGGPDHEEITDRDSTNPYSWTPQESAQQALSRLLDGVVDGSITETVRLRVKYKTVAEQYTSLDVSLEDPGGESIPTVSGTLTGGGSVYLDLESTDYGSPEVGFYRSDFETEDIEEEIKNLKTAEIEDYNTFIAEDPYWRTTEAVARNLDFSSLETKYFSITAGLDILRNGMGMSFLRGTLEHIHTLHSSETTEPTLQGTVGGAESVTLLQALVGMQILSLGVVGADDLIPHGASEKILSISRAYSRIGADNDLMGAAGRSNDLINPITDLQVVQSGEIDTTIRYIDNEMAIADLYLKRMAGYGKEIKEGDDPNRQYGRWKILMDSWQARYVDNLNTSVFGEENEHYLDWLKSVNQDFGQWIESSRSGSTEAMQAAIRVILVAVESEIDSDNLSFVSSAGFSAEQIGYLKKLLYYFKSYTVEFREISLALHLFDPVFNGLHFLSDIRKFDAKITLEERESSSFLFRIFRLVTAKKHFDDREGFRFSLGAIKKTISRMSIIARDLVSPDPPGTLAERISSAISGETLLRWEEDGLSSSRTTFQFRDMFTGGSGTYASPLGLLMTITNPDFLPTRVRQILSLVKQKIKVKMLLNSISVVGGRRRGEPTGLLLGATHTPPEEGLGLSTESHRSAFLLDSIPPGTPAGLLATITRSSRSIGDLRGDFFVYLRHRDSQTPEWVYKQYGYGGATGNPGNLDFSSLIWSGQQPSAQQQLEDVGLLPSAEHGSLLVYDPGDFHRLTRRRINGQDGWPFGRDQEWFEDFTIAEGTVVSTNGAESATWTTRNGDLSDNTSIIPDWLSGSGEDAYTSVFAIQRIGGGVQASFALRRSETGYPVAEMIDDVEREATWEVIHGSTNIDIGGPDHDGAGAVRDTTGPYQWTPQTSAQSALGALLDGLVAGTITDTVRLRVRYRSAARYRSSVADLGKVANWSIRVVAETITPPNPPPGSPQAPEPAATDITYTLLYGSSPSLQHTVEMTQGVYLQSLPPLQYAQVQVDLGTSWQGAAISALRLEWLEKL